MLEQNKLVYSAHYYDWHWLLAGTGSYEQFARDLDNKIAFMALDPDFAHPAPMWIGEFGTNKRNR